MSVISVTHVTIALVTFLNIPAKTDMQECPQFCTCFNSTANCSNNNDLTYIPELPHNITRLVFNANNLSIVEKKTFYNITNLNLHSLTLRNNRIENISKDALSDLKHLRMIDLSGNGGLHIQDVANTLQTITSCKLRDVYLNSMNWKIDPVSIFEALGTACCKIRVLIMENMELRILNFSAIETNLPYLETLKVNFNSIENLIPGYLTKLTQLNLAYNFIELKEGFFGINTNCLFPNLKYLDLKANFVNYFEGRFSCLKKLEILKLGNNPVKRILNNTFSELKSLKKLSITNTGNRLYFIDKLAFSSTTLKQLNLSGNYFPFTSASMSNSHFDPDSIFKYLPELEILNLSENRFDFDKNYILLRMIRPLKKLKHLTIKHCGLLTIPVGIFYKLPWLQLLDLSRNHIRSWNGKRVFQNMSSLEILRLELNYISSVKESLFPVQLRKNIKSINIAGNPFSCCCKNLWLRKWIEEDESKFEMFPENYFCDTPPELHRSLFKDFFPSAQECESINVLLTVTTTLSLIGIFIVLMTSLVYKGRWHIRHAVYLYRLKRKGYDTLEDCTNFSFSGFVIYCEDDKDWVLNKFVKTVEVDERRLCIHHRDFEVGRLIMDNIAKSITESRKVVLILSNAMINSDWCLFELRLANRKFLQREDSLLIIMLEKVAKKNMPSSLHTLLSIATYLQWAEDPIAEENFWKKVHRAIK